MSNPDTGNRSREENYHNDNKEHMINLQTKLNVKKKKPATSQDKAARGRSKSSNSGGKRTIQSSSTSMTRRRTVGATTANSKENIRPVPLRPNRSTSNDKKTSAIQRKARHYLPPNRKRSKSS